MRLFPVAFASFILGLSQLQWNNLFNSIKCAELKKYQIPSQLLYSLDLV